MFGTRKRLVALEAAVAAARSTADTAKSNAAAAQTAANYAQSVAAHAEASANDLSRRVTPTTIALPKHPGDAHAATGSVWFAQVGEDEPAAVFVQRGTYDEPDWQPAREDEV